MHVKDLSPCLHSKHMIHDIIYTYLDNMHVTYKVLMGNAGEAMRQN